VSATHLARYRAAQRWIATDALRLKDSSFKLVVSDHARPLMAGIERFGDFQRSLGIAPNILTARLEHLVESGLMIKRSYQEPGARRRQSYHLTQAGRDLALPLAALQQWGDEHEPHRDGPSMERRSAAGASLHVGLLDDADRPVRTGDLAFVPTARMLGASPFSREAASRR
jgi:DNA-binding HxlR family transcriptional regulator